MKIVGYISSDSFTNGFINQQIQNSSIKNFLTDTGHEFLLSWTEYKQHSRLAWRSLLKETYYQGVCFYSYEQIEGSKDLLNDISILINKNIIVAFAKEKILLTTNDEFKNFLTIYQLSIDINNNYKLGDWLERTKEFFQPTPQ